MNLADDEGRSQNDYLGGNKISLPTMEVSGSPQKKDGSGKGGSGNNQKKNPKNKKNKQLEDLYLNPPKRTNASSRRRQNTPLSQFNEILVNLVDNCITYDNTRVFHLPVKKSEFPTYYELVKNPIDLSTIKSKAKRCEYRRIADFVADMKLMRDNAETFNGPTHYVTTQGTNILERLNNLVEIDKIHIEELEAKVIEEEEKEKSESNQ